MTSQLSSRISLLSVQLLSLCVFTVLFYHPSVIDDAVSAFFLQCQVSLIQMLFVNTYLFEEIILWNFELESL